MDRRTIASIWFGGVVLMVVLYIGGPQHVIELCQIYLAQFWSFIGGLIEALTQRAFDAVRAAAIALYVVFVVLALLAGHRGLRSGAALFVITAGVPDAGRDPLVRARHQVVQRRGAGWRRRRHDDLAAATATAIGAARSA